MSDSNLPPEQWRYLFDKRKIDFGYRPLAAKLDMNHTRIRRLMLGGGTTDAALRHVADYFGVPVSEIQELRGESVVNREPFTLPDDAGRLNERERDVIRSMVRALLEARELGNALEAAKEQAASSEAPPHEKNPDEQLANNGQVDPLTGLDRWRGDAGEVEDGDDSADETG